MKFYLFILLLTLTIISCDDSTNTFDPNNSKYVDVSIEQIDYPNEFGTDYNIIDMHISEEKEFFLLTDLRFSVNGAENKIQRSLDLELWTELFKSDTIDADRISSHQGSTFISSDDGIWFNSGNGWKKIYDLKGEADKTIRTSGGNFIVPINGIKVEGTDTSTAFGYLFSSDNGETWEELLPWDYPIQDVIQVNPFLMVAIKNNEVIFSRNGGLEWTSALDLPFSDLNFIKLRALGDKIFYISEEGFVYYSGTDPSRSDLTALEAIYFINDNHFTEGRNVDEIYTTDVWEAFKHNDKIYFLDRFNGIFECSMDLNDVVLIENLYPTIYDIEYLDNYLYYKGGSKLNRLNFSAYISEMKEKY